MTPFTFERLVAVVRREQQERAAAEGSGFELGLSDRLKALQGLPRGFGGHRRWDPIARLKAMGKPLLRALGLYEPVRAWWLRRNG
ncbi:MAG: hypothetical protein FJ144_22325 [Deltaproteobacteria bacterium]|nr:hypothetical protein [Deltaproteobacteria bacterium]